MPSSRFFFHILAPLLLLGAAATVNAQNFYFNGYGGFSDPNEVMPASPADGADDDSDVGFLPPYDFANQSTFDTDVNAWATFEWFADQADHSHLSINELTPENPPASSNFADPLEGSIAVDSPDGAVIGWLIHHNEVLFGGTPFGPDNIAVHYHLDIYADAAKSRLLWSSGPLAFTLDMMETRNNGDVGANGICRDNNGGTTGDPTGFSPPCPDRFRVAEGWPSNPTGDGMFEHPVGTFQYQDTWYSVTLSGFWDGDTLIGQAWSAENTHNRFDIRATVTSLESPAAIPALPAIALVLLGLLAGLVGIKKLRCAS
jgi:hypothetical protein